jgi:uncharacterized protein YjbI with pentapeptide repeats
MLPMETKLIGKKIAKARKEINISQAQLAEHLFISAQAVGKWERGESMPDIITFYKLVEILGVDLHYFSENSQTVTTETPFGNENQPAGNTVEKLNWDMSRGNWVDADFSGLKNLHEKFSSSNMQRCKFIVSDLSGLLLKSNNVDSCDFSSSNINNSHIQRSHLNKNIFKDCSMKETEFSRSYINVCNFSGVNFTGTTFLESYLYGCDFTCADFTEVVIKSGGIAGVAGQSGDFEKNTIAKAVWNRTSFIDTQIADVVFVGTMEECYFENCGFTRVTFQNATLTNTFFKNKSLKRIQFINCKADRMTYEFLKNGKADLTGITLLAY